MKCNLFFVCPELCGLDVSSADVSWAAAQLDEQLESWRTRPLDRVPYLVLDARYEKVRHGGQVVSCAVLVAIGVQPDGRQSVLGVSVALSEAEVHGRSFLSSLAERGLHGVCYVVSDNHEGLKKALSAVLPSVPWQRCQFHLQQNAGHYVPRVALRKEVATTIKAVFNAPDRQEADRLLGKLCDRYRDTAPRLATWAEKRASAMDDDPLRDGHRHALPIVADLLGSHCGHAGVVRESMTAPGGRYRHNPLP